MIALRTRSTRARIAASATLFALAVVIAGPGAASAIVTTVDCATDDLGAAIQAAPPGSTLKLKGTCHGHFNVDRNLTIQGVPTATINGDGSGRPLLIFGFHTVRLLHLVVTGGVAQNGGGILFGGGSLTLDHVTVRGNSATGGQTVGAAKGGGIWVSNPAFLKVVDSTVTNNHVTVSGSASETASGGGIDAQGSVTITRSTVSANTVDATSDDNAGSGEGAGVSVFGELTIEASKINGNHATGTGPDFGSGRGGGVFWVPNGHEALTIEDSTFANNQIAVNTNGRASAEGGGLWVFTSDPENPVHIRNSVFKGNVANATSTVNGATVEGGAVDLVSAAFDGVELHASSTQFIDNSATATGVTDADGVGGALNLFGFGNLSRVTMTGNTLTIHAGTQPVDSSGGGGLSVRTADQFAVASSTIDDNTVVASSQQGVSVGGGGVNVAGFFPFTLRNSTVSRNDVSASSAAVSAEALGGGLLLAGTSSTPGDLVINSTVAGNTAHVDSHPGSDAAGGGIAAYENHLVLRFDTIVRNTLSAAAAGPFLGGGGLYMDTAGTHAEGVVLALNDAVTGPDCQGTGGSDGFNLLGDATGCSIPLAPSDQVNPTPKLGALVENGGPTQTVALLAASPALNRIPKVPCQAIVKKDQRGIARPQAVKCDEGAFERKP